MKKFVLDVSKNSKLSEFVHQNIPQLSYNALQKILRKKDVLVNRVRVNKDVELKKGDFVEIYSIDKDVSYFQKVYEDQNIIVVNKAFGIIVAKKDKTKPNELSLEELIEKSIKKPVFPLHRIDMNTSGLVVFCKSKKVFDILKESMKNHEVQKTYLAEVVGKYNLKPQTFVGYIEKDLRLHKSFVFNTEKPQTKKIETYAEAFDIREKTSVVLVKISNGKTHQIRAHLAHIGFPIVGDNKYGSKNTNKKFGTRKQRLLAFEIQFNIADKKMKYLNEISLKLDEKVVEDFFSNTQKPDSKKTKK